MLYGQSASCLGLPAPFLEINLYIMVGQIGQCSLQAQRMARYSSGRSALPLNYRLHLLDREEDQAAVEEQTRYHLDQIFPPHRNRVQLHQDRFTIHSSIE